MFNQKKSVFGYLVLISIDFYDFFLRFLHSFSFDWEDRWNTPDSSKHLVQVRQKYPATRHIFNFLLSVWICAQIQSFFFGILS